MINHSALYRKTEKGSEAIATRQHGLTPRLRSLLIMVDGKRSVEELARLGGGGAGGDGVELLEQLLAQGFIEAPAGTATAASAPAGTPRAEPAAGLPPTISLKEAQRVAARRLTDILGPNGQDLCLRIEGARSVADFQAAIARAQAIVREFRGADAAAAFAADMQALRPG